MASLCRLFIERVDDDILEARAGGLVEGLIRPTTQRKASLSAEHILLKY